MYYVYMLRCEDNSIYTGIAADVEQRFHEHMSGTGAKYTKSHKPLGVEAVWKAENKIYALKLEYRIKKLTKCEKEDLIINGGTTLKLLLKENAIIFERII